MDNLNQKQRTFKVGNEKITVRSKLKTSMGNHCGWYVWINGIKFYRSVLTRQEAEDSAYCSWIKKYAGESQNKR